MNKYDLAALLTINDLDGFKGKLPFSKQRELFGSPIFGKKTVDFDCNGQGEVRLIWWTDPTNHEVAKFSFEEICQYIDARKVIRL